MCDNRRAVTNFVSEYTCILSVTGGEFLDVVYAIVFERFNFYFISGSEERGRKCRCNKAGSDNAR